MNVVVFVAYSFVLVDAVLVDTLAESKVAIGSDHRGRGCQEKRYSDRNHATVKVTILYPCFWAFFVS